MTDPIKTLIVDNVEYPTEQFSPEIQNLLVVRQTWSAELIKERSAVVKTEAAIRQLEAELAQMVAKELAAANETQVSA